MTTLPNHRVLISDDEPDIHAITRLALRNMRVGDRKIELLSAATGRETVEMMREHPDIAVILLDVVMESDSAGLDACRAVRQELGNHFVRVVLRTGQPGVAPERETIDSYDIDGYLAKIEVTADRLYSTVRTAIKAYGELIELERHRQFLTSISDCIASLHSYAPLGQTLERVMATVMKLCPSPLAALHLETFSFRGDAKRFFLYRTPGADSVEDKAHAQEIRAAVARAFATSSLLQPGTFANGFLVPMELHRELGHGWIFIQDPTPDPLIRSLLPVLAAHAANAFYATIAQSMLASREGPAFEAMDI